MVLYVLRGCGGGGSVVWGCGVFCGVGVVGGVGGVGVSGVGVVVGRTPRLYIWWRRASGFYGWVLLRLASLNPVMTGTQAYV